MPDVIKPGMDVVRDKYREKPFQIQKGAMVSIVRQPECKGDGLKLWNGKTSKGKVASNTRQPCESGGSAQQESGL